MLTSFEQKDELFSDDNGSMGYTIIYLISANTTLCPAGGVDVQYSRRQVVLKRLQL
jgi:hypothetical protein